MLLHLAATVVMLPPHPVVMVLLLRQVAMAPRQQVVTAPRQQVVMVPRQQAVMAFPASNKLPPGILKVGRFSLTE